MRRRKKEAALTPTPSQAVAAALRQQATQTMQMAKMIQPAPPRQPQTVLGTVAARQQARPMPKPRQIAPIMVNVENVEATLRASGDPEHKSFEHLPWSTPNGQRMALNLALANLLAAHRDEFASMLENEMTMMTLGYPQLMMEGS